MPIKQHFSAIQALMAKLDNKQWAEEAESTGSYFGQSTCKNEFAYQADLWKHNGNNGQMKHYNEKRKNYNYNLKPNHSYKQ